jgi:hypothetical protein
MVPRVLTRFQQRPSVFEKRPPRPSEYPTPKEDTCYCCYFGCDFLSSRFRSESFQNDGQRPETLMQNVKTYSIVFPRYASQHRPRECEPHHPNECIYSYRPFESSPNGCHLLRFWSMMLLLFPSTVLPLFVVEAFSSIHALGGGTCIGVTDASYCCHQEGRQSLDHFTSQRQRRINNSRRTARRDTKHETKNARRDDGPKRNKRWRQQPQTKT